MCRLEVVKTAKGTASVDYAVHYYERQTFYKGSNGTITAEPAPNATSFYVWAPDAYLPWVRQPDVEGALNQALNWVSERRNNANPLH